MSTSAPFCFTNNNADVVLLAYIFNVVAPYPGNTRTIWSSQDKGLIMQAGFAMQSSSTLMKFLDDLVNQQRIAPLNSGLYMLARPVIQNRFNTLGGILFTLSVGNDNAKALVLGVAANSDSDSGRSMNLSTWPPKNSTQS